MDLVENMKICLLASASSIHTVRWVNALADLGHEISLITIQQPELDVIDNRVAIYELKIKNKLGYYLNFPESKRIIRKIKPDIINVHYASGYGTLGRLVHFEPTLLSVWGSDVYLFPYKSKWNEQTLRKNLRTASQIASTSHALKLQTKKFVENKLPIVVTPFGIDLDRFYSTDKKGTDVILIGTVKSLESIYGIDILINAVSELIKRLNMEHQLEIANKIRLKIVGDGSEKTSLIQLTKEKNIHEITHFVGAVSNDEVPKYLNELSIYCAFSRSESFGVAVLEASACEVPVVVSSVGGLPEVVKNGESGFIVNHNDIDMIVDKLYELVMDKNKRSQMGLSGREFVSKYYEWNNNVAHMVEIYEKLIANSRK